MAFILIVDDDEMIAKMTSHLLIEAGYACGWVSDAEQAIELLRWRRPDLILLDQNMPKMTGGTLLRKLRGSTEFYDLPVIMFTAIAGKEDENVAMFDGAQDYIRKPYTPKGLLSSIRCLLAARKARPKHRDLQHFADSERFFEDSPKKRYLA